jgi:thioredoxin reductase (NADPH)
MKYSGMFLCGFLCFTIMVFGDIQRKEPLLYDIKHIDRKLPCIECAIIGAGPAGLSAGMYAARGGADTVIFRDPDNPSLLSYTDAIENWPGLPRMAGAHVLDDLENQAVRFGARVDHKRIKSIDLSVWPFVLTFGQDSVCALSMIIATGAFLRKLGVPGEDAYWGKGVLSCVICDAPFCKDKDVIVVGGGDAAVDYVLHLAPYARSIQLLVRDVKLRAAVGVYKKLESVPHCTIQFGMWVEEIVGDGKHVTGAYCKREGNNERVYIPASWIFLALGQEPNTELVQGQVALTSQGYIKLYCDTQQTSVKGVSAGGMVSDKRYKQAGISAGEGCRAALEVLDFLKEVGIDEKVKNSLRKHAYVSEVNAFYSLKQLAGKNEFEQHVLHVSKPVLVEFYSPLCGMCKKVTSIIEAFARDHREIDVFQLDREKAGSLLNDYSINTLPTVIFFKEGKVKGRLEGPADVNEQALQKLILNI